MKAKSLSIVMVFALLLGAVAMPVFAAPQTAPSAAPSTVNVARNSAIFFVSDGMRQDLVEDYAAQGLLPTMNILLRNGAKAADNGLLTQAPPNTGAGWFSLATGAWSGVHGSTNNTFHKNGASFSSSTSFSSAGVLQAETLAQSAERGGKKVAQIEWTGGRSAPIARRCVC